MKKILSILLLTISILSFAQFTVTDTSENWVEIGKAWNRVILQQRTDKTKAKILYLDTNAILNRNLYSPTTQYSFEFSTQEDTLEKIYEIIKSHFESKKIEELTLDFPEGKMYIDFYKTMGSYGVQFKFDNKSESLDKNSSGSKRETFGFNLNQVNKIFGKSR
ncbi:hypothetical protein FCL53_10520 [Elizabethkingia meningoseptica]|uniref:hypothetical protein n=1 Tax=Elizabethkingia meningoseptica TaxID=238 RepID=UPI0013657E6D|nr:hypothetical protein [Elizabethkingia meningoseptica]MVW92398.1 hypothetical protein [Elizabethkingia meningoseptica]